MRRARNTLKMTHIPSSSIQFICMLKRIAVVSSKFGLCYLNDLDGLLIKCCLHTQVTQSINGKHLYRTRNSYQNFV